MCIASRIYTWRLILLVVLSVDGSPNTDVIDINPNSHTAALDLLAHLTSTQIYDKFSSPTHSLFKHQSDIINVRLHVYYIKHKPAQQLQFDIQFLIQLRWKDERLSFATKNLPDIKKIAGEKEFLDHIWSPNIYLAIERSPLLRGKQNKDVTVNILPDGTVLCDSRIMTSVVCGVKLGKFPLDQQKCYFNIETWNYTLSDLLLQWENDSAISISKETPFLAEYQLVTAVHLTDYNVETDSEIDNVHSCNSLRVMFVVSRKYGFYLMNYYMPSILIVAISWVTFWESPDATPGRCILGATTMLSFIFLGVEMSKSLPSKTYIRSNDIWFIGCTAFIFCALAEFAFANSLWRYGGEVELKKRTSKYILKSSLAPPKEALKPRRRSLSCPSSPTKRWENPLKRVVNNELTVKSLSDLEISLPLSELKTMKKETIEITEKPEPPPTTMSWQDIAVWIDKKSRIIFPISFLTFNIIYWGLLCIS